METTSNFDRMRAWTEGTMSEVERARFERELALDPQLARGAQDFRAVWKATEAGLVTTAASRTSFAELSEQLELAEKPRTSRWRRVAAAVLIVAPIGGYAWFKLGARDDPPQEIPAPIVEAPRIPDFLASWSPVENGSIRWLGTLDEARAASAAVGRPVFVFGYVEGCPLCVALREKEFQDPAILALVERSVPVAIDLFTLDEAARKVLWDRRYPLLELQDEHGTIVRTFGGTFIDVDVREELDQGLETVVAPPWSLVHELTASLLRAEDAEKRGDMGAATQEYERVARHEDAPVFAHAGEAALARLERTHR